MSAGDQVRLGSSGTIYSGPRTFTGLSAGSYTARARNVATDGTNTVYSSWVSCPTRTISAPAPEWTSTKPTLSCSPQPSESDLRQFWTNLYGTTYHIPTGWPWLYKLDGSTAYWGIWARHRVTDVHTLTSGVYTCNLGG